MHIHTLENGLFMVNSYLITMPDGTGLIIDPGRECEPLIKTVQAQGIALCAILITHPHIDHVDGIPLVKSHFPTVPVMMSAKACASLSEIPYQARIFGVPDPGTIFCDRKIEPNEILTFGSILVRTIETPGHCNGSLTFVIESSAFTGDVLFQGTIGRTDLNGGDFQTLVKSIRENLYTLPDSTRVYPGHGPLTTIASEKKDNSFVRI